jgi:hypothetical protein
MVVEQPLIVGVIVDVKLEVEKPDDTGVEHEAEDGNVRSDEEDERVMVAVVGQIVTATFPV